MHSPCQPRNPFSDVTCWVESDGLVCVCAYIQFYTYIGAQVGCVHMSVSAHVGEHLLYSSCNKESNTCAVIAR